MYRKITAGLIVASAMMPALAFAQTSKQDQIQSIVSQIQALQAQLKALLSSNGDGGGDWNASSTPPRPNQGDGQGQGGMRGCMPPPPRNLRLGSQGDDVKSLQAMLAQDSENEFHGTTTGFFGPMTARAMMKFQMRMGIASSSDGSVGSRTRDFLEKRCGSKGQGGQGGNPMSQGGIGGTITANSGTTITLQNKDGASKVVNIDASTSIQVFTGTSTPPTTGTSADLTVGKMARAEGPTNSDGSIQARHISVGMPPPSAMPMGGMMGGMNGDSHEGPPRPPMGMMPTTNGPQGGGSDGHPQNW